MAKSKNAAKGSVAQVQDKDERRKALDAAIAQIEKQFGAGSVMRMGEKSTLDVEALPTGSIGLDMALGIGGLPKGRIIEIYGPESSGKTTVSLHVIAEAQKLPEDHTYDQTLADYGGIVYNTWTKDDDGNYIYEYLGYVDDEIIAEVDELIANALPTYEISIYGNFTALEAGETFYIFNEEIERFFHGEITAEECASVLQDRISIYLSENYD